MTTLLGFTPFTLERAIQAQFLVPFAASLGFGHDYDRDLAVACAGAAGRLFTREFRSPGSGGRSGSLARPVPAAVPARAFLQRPNS